MYRVCLIHPIIGLFTSPLAGNLANSLEFQQMVEYGSGWPCWIVRVSTLPN